MKLSIVILIFFTSCDSNPLDGESYESRIKKCLKQAVLTEFQVENGGTGYSTDMEENCIINALLPKFETEDIFKNVVRTNDLKGKLNVINFWFINCAPCVQEIPFLNQIVKKYNSNSVNFISFTRDNTSQLIEFLKVHPFDFKIIPESSDIIKKTFHQKWGYPTTMITNRKNKIVAVINGLEPEEVYNKIDSILTVNLKY